VTERISAEKSAHFQQEGIIPALLGYFDFSSGPVRLWAPGITPIEWGGHTWSGCGALASIAALEESSEGRAISTVLELSPLPLTHQVDGVDIDILSIAHGEQWQHRKAMLYLGLFHKDSLRWLLDPFQIRKGFMDVMELTENGESAAIKLTLESRYYDLERAEVLRYTAETQRALYPDDAFFDQIALLQDKPIQWNLG
jgi:hypothetical protein